MRTRHLFAIFRSRAFVTCMVVFCMFACRLCDSTPLMAQAGGAGGGKDKEEFIKVSRPDDGDADHAAASFVEGLSIGKPLEYAGLRVFPLVTEKSPEAGLTFSESLSGSYCKRETVIITFKVPTQKDAYLPKGFMLSSGNDVGIVTEDIVVSKMTPIVEGPKWIVWPESPAKGKMLNFVMMSLCPPSVRQVEEPRVDSLLEFMKQQKKYKVDVKPYLKNLTPAISYGKYKLVGVAVSRGAKILGVDILGSPELMASACRVFLESYAAEAALEAAIQAEEEKQDDSEKQPVVEPDDVKKFLESVFYSQQIGSQTSVSTDNRRAMGGELRKLTAKGKNVGETFSYDKKMIRTTLRGGLTTKKQDK